MVGSLTGAVSSQSVTEEYEGLLGTVGHRTDSAMAKEGLTARLTRRAGAKAGQSDPLTSEWKGQGLTDKSYPGDNRLIASKRPQRRGGLAPYA